VTHTTKLIITGRNYPPFLKPNSAVGSKTKFGVSWQVVPTDMDEMMRDGTPEQIGRVTQAVLKMKKFDLAELRKAYEG
jgi:predicted 3-demethylubiquinone-9 3-methyltransferase (glyoxalase superfamily)